MSKTKKFKEFIKSVKPDYTVFNGERYFNIYADIKKRPWLDIEDTSNKQKQEKKLEEDVQQLAKQTPAKFSSGYMEQARDKISDPDHFEKEENVHSALSKHYSGIRDHWNSVHNSLQNYTQTSETLNSAMYNDEGHKFKHTVNAISNSLKQHKTPGGFFAYSGVNRSPERWESEREEGHPHRLHLKAFTSTSLSFRKAAVFSQGDEQSEHNYHIRATSQGFERKPVDDETKKKFWDWKRKEHGDVTNKPQELHDIEKEHGQIHSYKHVVQIHIPKGAHGAYVGHVSEHADEREFVLHHGSLIDVHHEPTVDHKRKTVYWHGRLVHDGIQPTRWAKEIKR